MNDFGYDFSDIESKMKQPNNEPGSLMPLSLKNSELGNYKWK